MNIFPYGLLVDVLDRPVSSLAAPSFGLSQVLMWPTKTYKSAIHFLISGAKFNSSNSGALLQHQAAVPASSACGQASSRNLQERAKLSSCDATTEFFERLTVFACGNDGILFKAQPGYRVLVHLLCLRGGQHATTNVALCCFSTYKYRRQHRRACPRFYWMHYLFFLKLAT